MNCSQSPFILDFTNSSTPNSTILPSTTSVPTKHANNIQLTTPITPLSEDQSVPLSIAIDDEPLQMQSLPEKDPTTSLDTNISTISELKPTSFDLLANSEIPIFFKLSSTVVYQQGITSSATAQLDDSSNSSSMDDSTTRSSPDDASTSSSMAMDQQTPQLYSIQPNFLPFPIHTNVNVIPVSINIDLPETSFTSTTNMISEPTIDISVQAVDEPPPEKTPQENGDYKRQKGWEELVVECLHWP